MHFCRYLAFAAALTLLLPGRRAGADQAFPGPEWSDRPSPLACPHAVPGGSLTAFAGQYPKSFNYYLDNNVFSAEVFSSLYETLLGMDPLTAEYVPGLARRWFLSDDKLTFTFHLDPRARWSDGRPVTSADVLWTYEAIMNPRHLTGVHRLALERVHPPEALDEHTVRFSAREVHWRNLGAVGGFHILPRHVFEGQDFNLVNFDFPVVSGPYRLTDVREGLSVALRRREDWWRRSFPSSRGLGNFDRLVFRFFAEQENAFEAFRKGLLDVFPVYTARLWINETRGERFRLHWIVKQSIENYRPTGFQGFAMNMRRPPFDDLRVRQALAHLLDREKMNRTLMYGQYFLHRSYYEDLYGPDEPCPNPIFGFDQERARALLAEAGWQVNPTSGLLEKNGKPFRFRFLIRDPSAEKFLALYAEDLRDVGIELRFDKKDWAAWSRDMDEYNFDMTWAAWGAGLFKDPESMWSSAEGDRPGGNNLTGFRDERVDRLIERTRTLFDVRERHALVREIDALVAAQTPYILLWNTRSVRLLYWNKFGAPPAVLSKFGDERAAYTYWWHDPDADAVLTEAMREGLPLPPRPPVIRFDEVFETGLPAEEP